MDGGGEQGERDRGEPDPVVGAQQVVGQPAAPGAEEGAHLVRGEDDAVEHREVARIVSPYIIFARPSLISSLRERAFP